MADSDPDEDGSAEVSCQEQQNSEGDEDVEEVEASGSRSRVKPILPSSVPIRPFREKKSGYQQLVDKKLVLSTVGS